LYFFGSLAILHSSLQKSKRNFSMGLESLHDLELAGVRWELSELKPKSPDNTARAADDKKPANEPPAHAKPCAPRADNQAAVSPPPAAPVFAEAAHAAARGADGFDALRGAIDAFNHPLKMFAKRTVPPRQAINGDAHASGLIAIVDAPSSEDEESGQILAGAAGALFDKMLGAIGLARDDVSICPLVFWRAPGGRSPTEEELALARPFVDRFVQLANPKAVLTLGTLAAKHFRQADAQPPVFSIPHPNYLILKPDAKKDAWETLKKLREEN
jgi:DNA polymerase